MGASAMQDVRRRASPIASFCASSEGLNFASQWAMRWLVYGAGNIGSLYAARLAQSSQDVSILARGPRLRQIRQHGIELEEAASGKRTTTNVAVVERLDPHDAYDLVLVVLPKPRIAEVLPTLAANDNTPSVLFFGNNMAGPGAMIDALGRERVLLGFPGAAAVPRAGVLRYVITSAREQPTTIGEVDGVESSRIQDAAAVLEAAGFPVSICPNVDAWLKTHGAKILPTVGALFQSGGDPAKLASDATSLRLMVRAIREGYRVLRANGVPITPANHRLLEWLPEAMLLFAMKRMMSSESVAIKVGHADGGRAEWQLLASEFRTMIDVTDVPTPSIDALFSHLDGPGHAMAPDLAS
jgi:2-dehydropantoate 2-reductase